MTRSDIEADRDLVAWCKTRTFDRSNEKFETIAIAKIGGKATLVGSKERSSTSAQLIGQRGEHARDVLDRLRKRRCRHGNRKIVLEINAVFSMQPARQGIDHWPRQDR